MASQNVKNPALEHATATSLVSAHDVSHGGSVAALVFGALGVVFGDIGTSPLYTLKECLHAAGGENAKIPEDLFGILSLMFWALILVVTVKYLIFVMRADHDGEGGIFALLAVVPERFRKSTADSGKVTVDGSLSRNRCRSFVRGWRDHAGNFRSQRRRGTKSRPVPA